MQLFDVHADTLTTNQNLLIEASAGTGKTYTIEQLFLRRLQEKLHGAEVKPKEVAIVTFTRAAANELKERIARASTHPLLDEATISTIHSFASRLLSEFYGEREQQFVSSDILRALIKEYFITHDPEIHLQELKKVLDMHRLNEAALIQELEKNLYKYAAIPSLQSHMQALEKSAVETGWSESFVLQELNQLSLHFTGLLDRSGRLKEEPQEALLAFSKLFGSATQDDTIAALMRAPFSVAELFGKPKAKATYNKEFLEILINRFQPHLEAAFLPTQIIKRITLSVERFVTTRLLQKGLFTPDSLMRELANALQDASFVAYARARFKAVFIDEFQDTDPQQWQIFSTLFLSPEFKGHLYLVGDPKQAIYSFRNADVYCYMQAKEHFQAHEKATLGTNFRSSPQLVSALNSLFKESEGIQLPKLQNVTLPIQEVQAGRSLEELRDGRRAIHFFEVKETLGRKRNWPHEAAEAKLFSFIVDELQALQLPLTTVAILVKDRHQAGRLQEFLKVWGIESHSSRRKSLNETEAFAFLKLLLQLIDNPRNRGALLSLLASPPLLRSQEVLETIERSQEAWAEYVQFFMTLKKMSPAAMVGRFLSYFIIQESEFIRDLEQLTELLEEKRREKVDSLVFLETLSSDIEVRFEPKLEGVSIMTLFKSKGLEFDVVFALALASRTQEKDTEQEAEKMRQFYVAATRAKRRLYLPHLIETTGKEAPSGCSSLMEKFLKGAPLSQFSAFATFSEQEAATPKEKYVCAPSKANEETFIEIAPFQARRLSMSSFTSQQSREFASIKTDEILPSGVETGIILHRLIEELGSFEVDREWVANKLYGTHLQEFVEPVFLLLEKLFLTPISSPNGHFLLKEIDPKKVYREMDFTYFSNERTLVRGSIDMAFEHEGYFYLIDFKSNRIEGDQYGEQAIIYCEAFRRYLKSFNLDENLLQGLFFIYLRTGGVQFTNGRN